ncbi:hypothetical protein KR074_003144 [Drosophila pseudoananassae]|nr:hypothetical protein KR074_003144 [Drosophila pseudoananassae]
MFALALKLAILVLVSQQDIGCHAQLSFHTDANTNSFTLKTPGLQQSFTRYYGSGTSQPLAETPTPAPAQAPALAPAAAQIPSFAGGFGPSSLQYPGAYQQAAAVSGKQKAAAALAPQQSQQFIGQPPLATNPPILGGPVGVGVASMPSYADQMHAAFIDYQRQRIEFEQQQQHLLQKLYHYYPDVSGSLPPSQIQAQPSEGGLPLSSPSLAGAPAAVASGTALGFGAGSGSRGSAGVTSSRFAYRRPHFSSNGLQPGAERGSVAAATAGSGSPSSNFGFSTGSSQQRIPGSVGDFYSTQQHMGFMQQQQQDVLRDQQQSVAHQFATSQLAPTTRQSYGMAVPMSSVLGTPSFQPSADVSHVSFSSGNLNYSF